jgi:hypothetical protein
MRIALIGAGGIGGWAARLLKKTFHNSTMEDSLHFDLYDKDTWEPRNADRQFMRFPEDIGKPKVTTLAADLGLPGTGEHVAWFSNNTRPFDGVPRFRGPGEDPFVIFSCSDNHPARRAALEVADAEGVLAVICGNEYTSASACIYHPSWCGKGRLDPRIRYPEIMSDNTGDPSRPCTGDEQEAHPQLAMSNYMAAGYGVWLLWYALNEQPLLTEEYARAMQPVEVVASHSLINVSNIKDLL